MTLNKEFAIRLEECMKKANITNKEITEALNLNKNAIGNCKKGQVPYAETLLDISNYLGTTIEYLLTGKTATALTKEENYLIELYRNTNEIGQPLTMKHAEDVQKALPRNAASPESSTSKIG